MKKVKLLTIIAVMIMIILNLALTTNVAKAYKPLPPSERRMTDASGLFFDNDSGDIAINEEILNIEFLDNKQYNVSSTYKVKNLTSNSVSVEAKFVVPYNVTKITEESKNSEPLQHTIKYYPDISDPKSNTRKWHESVMNPLDLSTKLGEKDKYTHYAFYFDDNASNVTREYITFQDNTTIMTNLENPNFISNTTKLLPNDYNNGFTIIADKPIEFDNQYKVKKTPIPDIYQYLQDKVRNEDGSADEYSYMRYLHNINVGEFNNWISKFDREQYIIGGKYSKQFHYEETEKAIINTLNYNITFLPNEEITLTLKYSGNNIDDYNFNTFTYYFTPLQYWAEDINRTINLQLNKDTLIPKDSNIKFKRTGRLSYQHKSNSVPTDELILVRKISKFNMSSMNKIIIGVYALFAAAILGFIYSIILIERKIKNNKLKKNIS